MFEVCRDFPGRVEVGVGSDAADRVGPVADRVELGVIVVVLGDQFETDLGFLVAEVDRDSVCAVEVCIGVGDYDAANREDNVADFDGTGLPLAFPDANVLAAPEGEEEGAGQ